MEEDDGRVPDGTRLSQVEPEHGYCPKCGLNLDGGLIWETGLCMARSGVLFKQRGEPAPTEADAEMLADDYAQSYGATRTRGQWGRAIHVKFLHEGGERKPDLWRCPECQHEWAYGCVFPPRAQTGPDQ